MTESRAAKRPAIRGVRSANPDSPAATRPNASTEQTVWGVSTGNTGCSVPIRSAQSGFSVRNLPDAVREVGEHALHAVRAWAEPRERELRRRRRARRRSLRWSAASGITAVGVAGLAIASAPVWAVVVLGGGAAALVTGAAMSTRQYLELRRNPLPQASFVPAKLPSVRSIAREPIARLVRAERAMYTLGHQIAQAGRLSAEDVTDTMATAASCAAALHALASDATALEKTIDLVGQGDTARNLFDQLRAIIARLDVGVTEYERLVAAAGRILTIPEPAITPNDADLSLESLRDCADRLDGWAEALTDLSDSRTGSSAHF